MEHLSIPKKEMKRVIFREQNDIPESLNGLLSHIVEGKGN